LDYSYPQKAILAYSQLLRYKNLLKTNYDNLSECVLEEDKIKKINKILESK
jgi:hypothetical protein